jgi:hypothetical protein
MGAYVHFASRDHALVVRSVKGGRALSVGDLLRGADGQLGAWLIGSRPLIAVADHTMDRIWGRSNRERNGRYTGTRMSNAMTTHARRCVCV